MPYNIFCFSYSLVLEVYEGGSKIYAHVFFMLLLYFNDFICVLYEHE